MIIHLENYKNSALGTKAKNLFRLLENGYPVPSFFCVDERFQEAEISAYLDRHFPGISFFSVRSSASVEDGTESSFAGQFRTFLRVKREEIGACIREVLLGAETDEVREYCRLHHIKQEKIRMHVIIQEMIEADRSGVLFTVNPQGILNESVIVVGAGTGDQVVEDRTDTTAYYYNQSDHVCYYEQTGASPLLGDGEIKELLLVSGQVRELFQTECDMEYAIRDGKLWLLQVRPVTALKEDGPVIVLDNSNIVESYPGITLPLTQSFIREAYYQVFRRLLLRLTGEPKTVRGMEDVLRNMVDMANGRVYYRISSWYEVLLLLPFCKKIIPVWQEMMGVREKTISACRGQKVRRRTRAKVAVSFFRLLLTCPKEMERLHTYFTEIIRHFESMDTDTEDNQALLGHYRVLQEMTVRRWDMTLVNDMYAFLFTGLLKARLKARNVPDYELEANCAISGLHKLESLGPIQELYRLAERAAAEGRLEELQKIRTREEYDRYMAYADPAFICQIQTYIQKFGDRNIEELKLESKTFRTDPALLVRRIVQYAENFLNSGDSSGEIPCFSPGAPAGADRPENAQKRERLDLLSRFLAERAALGICNREKSRLNRSRLYGMMRTLVLQMGKNLSGTGRIAQPDDIFWLGCGEIERASADVSWNAREIIARRKEEYEGFRSLPAWSRLVFSGEVRDRHPKNIQNKKYEKREGIFMGVACSQGIAEGEVLIVREPSLETDTKDRILVTRMTDPGWVFLIAGAKAIVAEKGSLLSHTAIIARELGKPAVAGIAHITEYLKDGDRVRVDGDAGTVTLLKQTPPDGQGSAGGRII